MPSTPPNVVNGTSGDDFINLSASIVSATINALGGSDTVWGSQGNDAIFGGSGGNIAAGTPQELNGQGGNDAISGGAGNDLIRGGAGVDFVFGGGGNDTFLLYEQDLVTTRPNGPGTQDVIGDFRGAGGWTNQGQNDFIALAGFSSGAQLLFDGRGAANAAGQLEYYHVADQGANYYFGVVIADRAPNAASTVGSLGLGDYAFL